MSTLFRIHYRTEFGDFISLRGSNQGLSWEQGIEATWISEEGEDVWILSLPLNFGGDEGNENDIVHFKPLINDEVWAKGCDYIVRPGGAIDIYPFFFAEKGSVFRTSHHSRIFNANRKLAFYLPPSYHENPFKRYPVILFNDGHNLFYREDSYCGDTWQLGETLDYLSTKGGIQEYIVVGIYPLDREFEYLPAKYRGVGGGADTYLDSLVSEIKPLVFQNLRTSHECAIAGSSYGGIISLYAWITRPHEFHLCGAFSPSLKYANSLLPKIVKENLLKRPDGHKLYMDCGSIRDQQDAVLELAGHIDREGPLTKEQFKFVVGDGHEHTERHWAIRTPRALAFLFSDSCRSQSYITSDSEGEGEGEAESDYYNLFS